MSTETNPTERHWSERGIWELMNRAEPAMRDELMLAWKRAESAEAALARVTEWLERNDGVIGFKAKAELRAALLPLGTPKEPK